MWRHMLPNALGPLVVVCAANFAAAILIEAGLSFWAWGPKSIPSWGNIVKEHAHLLTTPHAWAAWCLVASSPALCSRSPGSAMD